MFKNSYNASIQSRRQNVFDFKWMSETNLKNTESFGQPNLVDISSLTIENTEV